MMVDDDTMLKATMLQKQFFFSSRLLVVSSTLTSAPLLLFVCGPFVFNLRRTLHSLLCFCTRFFFSLFLGKDACFLLTVDVKAWSVTTW